MNDIKESIRNLERSILWTDGICALAVAAMPFTYSISDGIMFGVIAYTLINACVGNFKRIHWIMYVLTLVFTAKYALM